MRLYTLAGLLSGPRGRLGCPLPLHAIRCAHHWPKSIKNFWPHTDTHLERGAYFNSLEQITVAILLP